MSRPGPSKASSSSDTRSMTALGVAESAVMVMVPSHGVGVSVTYDY
ncbi:Uncharacterised protein [Mycobacteroides abscessus subsp. abscessus]|nr:Uncharacterised protein [Mycobacteroides abscessus subsp. abscessus]